ncbi:chemotaxis protein CheA [Engelhardtia mirabilis]
MASLQGELAVVSELARAEGRGGAHEATIEALARLDAFLKGEEADGDAILTAVSAAVDAVQRELNAVPTDPEETQGDSEDLAILADFLSDQKSALDEIEELALTLDDPDGAADIDTLKGRIHTLKGESGVLSMSDVSALCHEVESAIEASEGRDLQEYLLNVVDWLRRRFKACELGTAAPAPFQASVVPVEPEASSALDATAPDPTSDEAPAMAAEPPPAEEEPQVDELEPWELTGDPELTGDFIVEAREHTEAVDHQLLTLERDPTNAEAINAIFRAFHTIKGLAGFLELDPIQRLAHEAETMLDRVRAGQMDLAGRPLAATFEVNDVLKGLLGAVEVALTSGDRMSIDAGLPTAIRCLEELLRESSGSSYAAPLNALAPQPAPTSASTTAEVSDDDPGPEQATPAPAAKRAAPAARQPADPEAGSKKVAIREMIKVDATRLDALVDSIGELVIAEAMVSQSEELNLDNATRLPGLLNRMDKITRELQEMAMSLRMVPIRSTFRRMARLARDVATKVGKQVEFHTLGEDTELDKTVVDSIGDPLIHMVRNAVDHGLEATPEDRIAAGKPACGRVELRAFHQGGSIHIEIEDDGRGLDSERILAKAREKGIIGENENLTESEIYDLVFAPGFSTAKVLSDVSGRGVGLDVVKRNIEALRGTVEIRSTLGKGTIFSIRLPLTLAIIDGMVVRAGGERYIFPTVSIVRMVRPEEERLTQVFDRGALLKDGDSLVSLFHISRIFNLPGPDTSLERTSAVIVEHGDRRCAFLVDEILGQHQIVIKPLGPALAGTPGLAGGAIMPDGHVGLILDIASLTQLARTGSNDAEALAEAPVSVEKIEAVPAT